MTQLSFIIPCKDEQGSVELLYQSIIKVVNSLKKSFEIIFIDDGSTDNTFKLLTKIKNVDRRVKLIQLRGNFGKSIALQIGFNKAQGEIIFTMDADLQDEPNEIPNFIKKINEGFDMVSGWKVKRYDPLSKTFPSKIGNALTRKLTGVRIHDLNCGFKAYRKDVAKSLNLYGEMYKFIPILLNKDKFRITEVPVIHHKRQFGKSKYNWKRNLKGISDLITVIFLTSFGSHPGQLFSGAGIISFFFGFLIGLFVTYLRITTGSIQDRQPLLILGLLLMIAGVQLISTGLIAEIIIFANKKFDYSSYIK